ncbi:hypothetical protein ABW20_dc0104796 [Dactylellina cionopaga]|nr:hypothetical protein ABW20_dc0104796 [Dactylellina cionopaga]
MHLKLGFAFAVLALTPEIAGHGLFVSVVGDAAPGIKSSVLGLNPDTPRDGVNPIPHQRDVPVLKSPIVPATLWSKCWGKPRVYFVNGCSATIMDQNNYYANFPGLTTNRAKAKELPRVSVGGWIRIIHHQVNADGAGPFRCKISSTGAPNNWNPGWITPNEKHNVPGSIAWKSFRWEGTLKQFPLTINIPKNLKCNGSFGGLKNICMMRCENYATNGPFGGCVPFQLLVPPAPPPPPPPAPKPYTIKPAKPIPTKDAEEPEAPDTKQKEDDNDDPEGDPTEYEYGDNKNK